MEEYKETGGAYIGNGRATAPFATFKVNKHLLQLNAGLIGNLVFRASDIVSITPNGGGLFGGGVSINHHVNNYKQKVVFVPTSSSAQLIEQITRTGFLNNTEPLPPETEQYVVSMQTSGVYPVKTPAIIAIIVIWNLLILPMFISSIANQTVNFHSNGPKLALGFMFLLSLSILVSPQVRKLVLKEGRTIDGLKVSLYFLMFISGVMFLAFTAFSAMPVVPK